MSVPALHRVPFSFGGQQVLCSVSGAPIAPRVTTPGTIEALQLVAGLALRGRQRQIPAR